MLPSPLTPQQPNVHHVLHVLRHSSLGSGERIACRTQNGRVRTGSACFPVIAAVFVTLSGSGAVPSTPAAVAYTAPPQQLAPGQHAYASTVGHVRVRYLLYAPAAYAKGTQRWPLVVFLHGSGERGTDPSVLDAQPLPKTLATTRRFPAVVLSPQLPPLYIWWSDFIGPVDSLVLRLETEYRIDPGRVYLTGLSLGGFGTWSYGLRHPERFAALVPIAGGYIQGSTVVPQDICRLRSMPIWAFHGQRTRSCTRTNPRSSCGRFGDAGRDSSASRSTQASTTSAPGLVRTLTPRSGDGSSRSDEAEQHSPRACNCTQKPRLLRGRVGGEKRTRSPRGRGQAEGRKKTILRPRATPISTWRWAGWLGKPGL
jgi:poly(3-hydroxybutyrate) depolymerase